MIDKLRLSEYFSKAAKTYDRYALLQFEISKELLNRLKGIKTPLNILDIGAGTARLTKKLPLVFPETMIFGLDFAYGMLEVARKNNAQARLIQAEAENLPFKNELFDLVISNLVYQWIQDLDSAFRDVYRVLKKEARLCFSCFGKETLRELRASFNQLGKLFVREPAMPHRDLIMKTLKECNFRQIELDCQMQRLNFKDLFNLVSWLKDVGANYTGKTIFLGREKWQRANDFYLKNFRENGRIFASFEVIWVQAQK